MTNPPNARSRRARIRQTGAAVLLASGLAVSGTAVASAGAPAAASTSRPSVDVVGLKKGAYGDAVKALQEALVRVGVADPLQMHGARRLGRRDGRGRPGEE